MPTDGTGNIALVLGAGASYPYGYPLGTELKNTIANELRFGVPKVDKLVSRLIEAGFKQADIHTFGTELSDSGQASIDRFLERRQEFTDIGKVAIAASIIRCESHRDRGGDWYALLYRRLFRNSEPSPAKELHVITFNYDISLEQYLARRLKADYHLSDQDAEHIVESLRIVHVHGWVKRSQLHTNLNGCDIRKIAEQIRIVSDGESGSEFEKAQRIIQDCSTIVFLGFGYDRTNIERLAIRNGWPRGSKGDVLGHESPPSKQVTGSVCGFTCREIERIKSLFEVHAQFDTQHVDLDAYRYLRETALLFEP